MGLIFEKKMGGMDSQLTFFLGGEMNHGLRLPAKLALHYEYIQIFLCYSQ